MTRHHWAAAVFAMLALRAPATASCGDNRAGFEEWKQELASELEANGVQAAGIAAFMKTHYSPGTISADRGQKNHKLSLEAWMAKRGAASIAKQGKRLKRSRSALLATIEKTYGVPPGPLLAIWGMETGFGRSTGQRDLLSSIATLAYDCRRSAAFTEHLTAALTLVDQGTFSSKTRGDTHGEVGQTQFMPKNVLLYGVDGDGDGRIDLDTVADALASTANLLKAQGWVAGAGYQPGEPNFAAIQGWNAASVYQQAIAIVAKQIDDDAVATSAN